MPIAIWLLSTVDLLAPKTRILSYRTLPPHLVSRISLLSGSLVCVCNLLLFGAHSDNIISYSFPPQTLERVRFVRSIWKELTAPSAQSHSSSTIEQKTSSMTGILSMRPRRWLRHSWSQSCVYWLYSFCLVIKFSEAQQRCRSRKTILSWDSFKILFTYVLSIMAIRI